ADPVRLDAELRKIVNDHICGETFAQRPAIAETGRVRGQRRESIVRFFQRDALLVANQPSEKIGGVRAASEELGMRAAVRYAGNRVRRAVNHLGVKLAVET